MALNIEKTFTPTEDVYPVKDLEMYSGDMFDDYMRLPVYSHRKLMVKSGRWGLNSLLWVGNLTRRKSEIGMRKNGEISPNESTLKR